MQSRLRIFGLAGVVLLVVLASAASAAAAPAVNGEYWVENGIPILHVWGTPHEMGFAEGYYTADQFRTLIDGFIVPLVQSGVLFELLRAVFTNLFTVPAAYEEEAQGFLDGVVAAGGSIHVDMLGRDLNAGDIGFVGAMPDLDGFVECTSMTGWGVATQFDATVAGGVAIVRNMDWMIAPGDPTLMARTTTLIARQPKSGRATVAVAFPGMIGCLSCLNEIGLGALQHQGDPLVMPWDRDYSKKFVPIDLSIRAALEDENVTDIDGVAAKMTATPRSSSTITDLVGKLNPKEPPREFEADNLAVVERYAKDDPRFPKNIVAAANDFLLLIPGPPADNRYGRVLADALDWGGKLTLDRMWTAARDVEMNNQGYWAGWITAHTMIFLPDLMRIGVAYSDQDKLAPEKSPAWFEWGHLFGDDDDDTVDDDASPDDDDDSSPSPSGAASSRSGCGC